MADHEGPRVGDVVTVEVSGRVIEHAQQDGTDGLLIELVSGGSPVWRLPSAITLVRREP